MDAIQYIQQQLLKDRTQIDVKPGDNVNVSYKIIEGDKERIQNFKGDVIQISGSGLTKTICIRKISNGVGVERIFPLNSPNIVEIELLKKVKLEELNFITYVRCLERRLVSKKRSCR